MGFNTTDSIDFFQPQCTTVNVTARHFGICDPQDGGKAFVDYDDYDSWIAVVRNDSGEALNFTAIDNCIDIRRENGDMENRCDALLTGPHHIIFVELKDVNSDWIQHAVHDQLQTTIDIFKQHHPIQKYSKRFAYACNKQHPRFQVSHKQLMNDFYHRNRVRLCIVNEIVVK